MTLRRHLTTSGHIFDCRDWLGGVLLTSSGQRSRILQTIRHHTGQPTTTQDHLVQNVSRGEVEKRWVTLRGKLQLLLLSNSVFSQVGLLTESSYFISSFFFIKSFNEYIYLAPTIFLLPGIQLRTSTPEGIVERVGG